MATIAGLDAMGSRYARPFWRRLALRQEIEHLEATLKQADAADQERLRSKLEASRRRLQALEDDEETKD
jgi:hypothetical protein